MAVWVTAFYWQKSILLAPCFQSPACERAIKGYLIEYRAVNLDKAIAVFINVGE